jgi:hypothetical protein
MPDLPISGLPAASTPLAGTEELPVVQGGTTDRVSVANLTAGRAMAAGSLAIGGATIGSNALAVTGSGAISGAFVSSGTITGNNLAISNALGGFSIAGDTIITRGAAAATFRLGAADAAAPVAQTLTVQSVVAGTSNTAGTNLTIAGSKGTGTGAGGSIEFQTAPAGASGSAQNALVTRLTVNPSGTISAGGNFQTSAGSFVVAGRGGYSMSADGVAIITNAAATNSVTLTVGASNLLTLNGALTTTGNLTLSGGGNLFPGGSVYMSSSTVAALPTAVGQSSARRFVTDALGPVFGTAVVGGGAVRVPVYSDNVNWIVG